MAESQSDDMPLRMYDTQNELLSFGMIGKDSKEENADDDVTTEC